MPDAPSPYMRGWHAAMREEEYAGAKDCPENPYHPGSRDHDEWQAGFGEGTDALYWLQDLPDA
jgi:hypothetical protein